MRHVCLDGFKFADFRKYTEGQWSDFRASLIRIVKWSFGSDDVQPSDIEDITQDILLGIQRTLHRPAYKGREERDLKKYAFRAARNRVSSHFRRSSWARKYHALADDSEIPVPNALSGDLVLVGEAFNTLNQKDRDRLEGETFGDRSTLETAGGSKREANRLYKHNSDARARFRAALLQARRKDNAVIHHLNAKFINLKEAA